jgi:hypothetical protein
MRRLAVTTLSTALLLANGPAEAIDLRGGALIIALQRNALSGTMRDGTPFQMFILPGGEATVRRGTGTAEIGAWRLDEAGDICLKFPAGIGETGCYRVAADGHKLRWSNKQASGHGKLLGDVADLKMSEGQ